MKKRWIAAAICLITCANLSAQQTSNTKILKSAARLQESSTVTVAEDEKDIARIVNAMPDGSTIVLDGEYVVSSPLILHKKYIQGGTIRYKGPKNGNVITIRQDGGIFDTKIIVDTKGYCSDIILVDYTASGIQYDRGTYKIDNVFIDNTIDGEKVYESSTVIRIHYNKYQVIARQVISNVSFVGATDYGIYIEPLLRNEKDNPVYNTTVFENIYFDAANCALKVCPKMQSGKIENARGGVGLLLQRFDNQHKSFVKKPFMDLVNTTIEGDMVIPWDYYDKNIPEEGTYKTLNSQVFLKKTYFPDTRHDNSAVSSSYITRSTGEVYSSINAIEAIDQNDKPVRNTGIGWAIDNVKVVRFSPQKEYDKYETKYVGFEFQQNNSADPKNNTYQIGVSKTGKIVKRHFDSKTGKWEAPQLLYSEGNMPTSSKDNRPDGVGIGDMKFDTTLGKPVWWTGKMWVTATGEKAF